MLAERLGCTPRNVQRYLALVETPMPVQLAFEKGELSLVQASRVATLPTSKQQEIVDAIQSGERPDETVKRSLCSTKAPTKIDTSRAYEDFLKQLAAATDVLDEQVDEIKVGEHRAKKHIEVLSTAINFLERIRKREMQAVEEPRQDRGRPRKAG